MIYQCTDIKTCRFSTEPKITRTCSKKPHLILHRKRSIIAKTATRNRTVAKASNGIQEVVCWFPSGTVVEVVVVEVVEVVVFVVVAAVLVVVVVVVVMVVVVDVVVDVEVVEVVVVASVKTVKYTLSLTPPKFASA